MIPLPAYLFTTLDLQATPRPHLPTCSWPWLLVQTSAAYLCTTRSPQTFCLPALDSRSWDHTQWDSSAHLYLTLASYSVPSTGFAYLCLTSVPKPYWADSSAYLHMTLGPQTIPTQPALPTCTWPWVLRPYITDQLRLPVGDPESSDHTQWTSSAHLYMTLAPCTVPSRPALLTCAQLWVLRPYPTEQFCLPVHSPGPSVLIWQTSLADLYMTRILRPCPAGQFCLPVNDSGTLHTVPSGPALLICAWLWFFLTCDRQVHTSSSTYLSQFSYMTERLNWTEQLRLLSTSI